MSNPSNVHIRVKYGMVEINDVEQHYRPDVNVFFYFKPANGMNESPTGGKVRFENIEQPSWIPHFDFENEIDEMLVTDESYWLDNDTGLIFGRKNMVPHLQERFDHQAFPFDRQIFHTRLLANNCLFQTWKKKDRQCPPELHLQDEEWQIQGELCSLADSWDLKNITMDLKSDRSALSSLAHISVYVERKSKYYILNIGFVLFLINLAQACMFVYPYNESRFNFALNLVLVSVAFKFVTQTEVPKTSYSMKLDKYMAFGFLVLFARMAFDTYLQSTFDLPEDEDGYRGKCDEVPGEMSPCTLDNWATAILTIIWVLASIYFLILGPFLRPRWNSMLLAGKNKRLGNELMGKA